MKAVGKQAGEIPDIVATNVSKLIALAAGNQSILIWLRDAVLLCVKESDFDKRKADIRSMIQQYNPEMLEGLFSECLSSEWPCDKVRSYIVEEYVRLRVAQAMQGCTILRDAAFYDDTGCTRQCGEANLDVFAGSGLFEGDRLCLSIDGGKPCMGYECKVKLSSWLSVKGETLDEECKKKLDFMACVAMNLPNATIRFASLETGEALQRARETLSLHNYGEVKVLSIVDV